MFFLLLVKTEVISLTSKIWVEEKYLDIEEECQDWNNWRDNVMQGSSYKLSYKYS